MYYTFKPIDLNKPYIVPTYKCVNYRLSVQTDRGNGQQHESGDKRERRQRISKIPDASIYPSYYTGKCVGKCK